MGFNFCASCCQQDVGRGGYIDTYDKAQQWHRTVEAEEALPRLFKFLDQLRWFPAEVLKSIGSNDRP